MTESITTYQVSPRTYPDQRELEVVAGTGWVEPTVDEYFNDLVARCVVSAGSYVVMDHRPGHLNKAYEYKVKKLNGRLVIV